MALMQPWVDMQIEVARTIVLGLTVAFFEAIKIIIAAIGLMATTIVTIIAGKEAGTAVATAFSDLINKATEVEIQAITAIDNIFNEIRTAVDESFDAAFTGLKEILTNTGDEAEETGPKLSLVAGALAELAEGTDELYTSLLTKRPEEVASILESLGTAIEDLGIKAQSAIDKISTELGFGPGRFELPTGGELLGGMALGGIPLAVEAIGDFIFPKVEGETQTSWDGISKIFGAIKGLIYGESPGLLPGMKLLAVQSSATSTTLISGFSAFDAHLRGSSIPALKDTLSAVNALNKTVTTTHVIRTVRKTVSD
jgi:hypothetical protein